MSDKVLVPVEITGEMMNAFFDEVDFEADPDSGISIGNLCDCYKAMIEAAPEPVSAEPVDDIAASGRDWLPLHPRPTAQVWVKCSDRMPTEEDKDYEGNVFGLTKQGNVIAVHWSLIAEGLVDCTRWTRSGFKKPSPPE